jgi:hypothetical protein
MPSQHDALPLYVGCFGPETSVHHPDRPDEHIAAYVARRFPPRLWNPPVPEQVSDGTRGQLRERRACGKLAAATRTPTTAVDGRTGPFRHEAVTTLIRELA